MGQVASSQRPDGLQTPHPSDPHPTEAPEDRPESPESPESPDLLEHTMGDPADDSRSLASALHASPLARSIDMADAMSYHQEGGSLAELDSRNTEGTRVSETSAQSRRSTMSRLGSRLLPNAVVRSLLNSGEESPAEGYAHRTGLLSRSLGRPRLHQRFASFSGVGTRGISRRRSNRGPYPLPRGGDAALLPDSPAIPAQVEGNSTDRNARLRFTWRRHGSRFSNVRQSIFGSPPGRAGVPTSTPRRLSRSGDHEDSDNLIPPLVNMDDSMGQNEPHELDSVETATRDPLAPSQGPSDNGQPPLSRILRLAAATIAAQLSGTQTPSGSGINPLGPEGLDGPLESLLQSLQGATAGQTGGSDGNTNPGANDGNQQNVNFLRVFRFANSNAPTTSPSRQQETTEEQMDVDGQETSESTNGEEADRRLLTLVVVGVRSMPPNHRPGSESENPTGGRLNLENLLPFLSPGNFLRSNGSPRRSERRSRGHRHSLSAASAPSAHPTSPASSRRQSEAGELASSLPSVFTESPAGPNPPPSTPAEPNLSRVASGANTPSRRPSSASAFLPRLAEDPIPVIDDPIEENPSTFAFSRQRRRSDSEAARHRRLGSGAARRNGVVEPDRPSPNTTRSWLIYVIGTNLAENHPAFATPSLFTDNPTYEDMIMLSTLLGPAKPPVASQEDVESAGGLYHLVEFHGSLLAEAVGEGEHMQIAEQDRCLICLSDYEAGEELRKLRKCNHIYHRECIDEVCLSWRSRTISKVADCSSIVASNWSQLLSALSWRRSSRIEQSCRTTTPYIRSLLNNYLPFDEHRLT